MGTADQMQGRDQPTPLDALVRDYAAKVARGSAHSDEMLLPDGTLRPVWADFMAHLAGLTPDQIATRMGRGNQYLHDAGVFYRQYDAESREREWPLSHIPVLLSEAEWAEISQGLIERAELLDFVLRDFYGENTLVNSGQLPPTLLTKNPAWLRPMIGALEPGEAGLNSVSFEVSRGPDGRWWVISDLIEAPSTAGFAIENRIATSRVFPNFFSRAKVLRLAGYFRQFQQTLLALKSRVEGEMVLLSPGPMNQNYAEHAFLARYLGMLLVEGEDLAIQDGQAMVRTVDGPRPVSLIWNRVPSLMTDPLELAPESMLGTPGLLQAVRDGAVHTVNMIGAGVLETRALMAFLPSIARKRLGRGLALPNIATWWCGQEAQRAHVLQNAGAMMVGDAFSTRPLMADPATVALERETGDPATARLVEMLETEGHNFVGQEAVTLSSTPVFEDGAFRPRPVCIRISLGRTDDGWAVMPGGYARVSASDDAKALAMQQGGKVADVWVLSEAEVAPQTLIATEDTLRERGSSDQMLPSRAADNLFWLGRYVERAEHHMRLFRAYFARIADGAGHDDPLHAYLRTRLLPDTPPEAKAIADHFTQPLELSLQTAARVTDRFSPDGMMALRTLVHDARDLDRRLVALDDIPGKVSTLLRQITGFAGLVHENMYRSHGWRFLSLGLSLERAANLAGLLAACLDDDAPEGALDAALEIGDSIGAHRTRFLISATGASVADLLGLDTANPRAIRYHITRAKDHIAKLPQKGHGHILSDVAARILTIETRLAVSAPENLTSEELATIRYEIWGVCDALNASHLG